MKVRYEVRPHFDDLPVRGNAYACGDAIIDRQIEDSILERIHHDDVWAWAWVQVIATSPDWPGHRGEDSLGPITCENEKDFEKIWGTEMRANALRYLCRSIAWETSEPRDGTEETPAYLGEE